MHIHVETHYFSSLSKKYKTWERYIIMRKQAFKQAFYSNHMVFLTQSGINLHEQVFWKDEIALATSTSASSVYEKLTSLNLFQIEREKLHDYLLIIQTWKLWCGRRTRRSFSKPFFSHLRKFPHKIFVIILCDITGFENFLFFFFQPIIIQNYDVQLIALVLQLNCTALSQICKLFSTNI